MFICSSCINDSFLNELVISQDKAGNCDFCETPETKIIEVKMLRSFFEPLIDLYKPVRDIKFFDIDDKKYSTGNIINQLNEDWNHLFDYKVGYSFLSEMLSDDFDIYSRLFEEHVLLEPKYGFEHRHKNIKQKKLWIDFKTEIKEEFRFLGKNSTQIKEFSKLLRSLVSKIPTGSVLYRSRISNEDGFDISLMGAPPKSKAVAGRVNPKGIPYLYLTKELETSISEVRAGLHDFVSIAEFKVLEDLQIVNFQPIKYFSPFTYEQEVLNTLLEYDDFIQEISLDMSKPNRRFDSDVDYIPTQFIVELVKEQIELDGVEYTSSMSKSGRNICLFKSNKLEPSNVIVKTVNEIEYTIE